MSTYIGFDTQQWHMLQADRQRRASWLISAYTVENTRFYNSLGFFTVKQFLVGENNPRWNDEPVQVNIVSTQLC